MEQKSCSYIGCAPSPTYNYPTCQRHDGLICRPIRRDAQNYARSLSRDRIVKAISSPALGFIGRGVMGYPMAVNLLRKLETGTQLHVYEVSSQALEKFKQEAPGLVSVCSSASEVAEEFV